MPAPTPTGRAEVPDVPTLPEDVEDYVAALFQAAGYYVDKNIVEQDDHFQVLELDAVATSYDTGQPQLTIAEVKSGEAGFKDAFKVVGWMRYLGIERGALFSSAVNQDSEAINGRLNVLGFHHCSLGDCRDAATRFSTWGFGTVADRIAVDVWRFSYGMERRLLHDLRHLVKTAPDKAGPRAVHDYVRLIRDETFFQPDVRVRVRKLYAAYSEHPKLSLGCAREIDGEEFDTQTAEPNHPRIAEALFQGKHDVLQYCFYTEHRARLALLKAAIDYHCALEAGEVELDGDVDWTAILNMPGTFRAGLQELSGDEYFRRYALFWQVFLWSFGGFYLRDRQDTEFEWLAKHTGIPAHAIPRALAAFDELFPIPGGWLATAGPSKVRVVKMMPVQLRAIGAFHRQLRYGVHTYQSLGYTDYTTRDLVRWHNAGIDYWEAPRRGFGLAAKR